MLRKFLLWFFEYSPPVIIIGMVVFSVVVMWPGWDREHDNH